VRGYLPGRFSFNVKGGRCEACRATAPSRSRCTSCPTSTCRARSARARYNRETLEVLYKGKNIAEVLDMSVEEALEFFENQPDRRTCRPSRRRARLRPARPAGHHPVRRRGAAGQAGRELGKRSTGQTFYILDEPTTGLHFEDIRKLLEVLQRLVDQGNTVLVIEHNLDVIKTADWVIDLGPEGGSGGGASSPRARPRMGS
jgi:excinuclease ABC subunit A